MSFEKALALLIEQARQQSPPNAAWSVSGGHACSAGSTGPRRPRKRSVRPGISIAQGRRYSGFSACSGACPSNEQHEEAFTQLRQVIRDSAGVFMMSPQASFGREFADLYNQLPPAGMGRVEASGGSSIGADVCSSTGA
jgi:hypothetical protein